ncbi:MAG: alpha/beta hydrolase [Phycisphaerales bacterium]|nr:alpha/beta hydrolase [Phycisphaerales bacterium]
MARFPTARTVAEMRAATEYFGPLLNDGATGTVAGVGRVWDVGSPRDLDERGQPRLLLRVIEPVGRGASDDAGPARPVCVFVHGGGWVTGSVASYRSLTHGLVGASERIGAEMVVVAVEYRLAPETSRDEIVDDVVSAVRWVWENAPAIGGDPSRVVIAGDSAGAQLAVIAADRLRATRDAGTAGDESHGARVSHALAGLVLLYGVLDFEALDMPALAGILQMRKWFLGALDTDASERARFDPKRRVSGAGGGGGAAGEGGWPRMMVVGAAEDALVNQSVTFADAARRAGVNVELRIVEGVPHGFLQCGLWPPTGATLESIGAFVRGASRDERGARSG